MQPNLFNYNLAEIEVSYKTNVKASERKQNITSKDAEEVFRQIWNPCMELKEEAYILLLNRANKVLGWHKISEGGIDGTVIDPRLIFSVALKGLACSIIIAHNHPSGNLQPSKQDIAITERIKQAGKLLGIQLQDHLILSNEGSFSFANEDRM